MDDERERDREKEQTKNVRERWMMKERGIERHELRKNVRERSEIRRL